MPPGFMMMQLLFGAIPLGGLAFFGWLGLRFVRAKERDAAAHHIESARPSELARIQDTLLAMQTELHALRERQEFVERLLERPRQDKLNG